MSPGEFDGLNLVNRLTTPEELDRARSAFRRVFAKATDVDPFADHVTSRLLLYRIDYTGLEREQFDAIASASRAEGIHRAYLVGLPGEYNPTWEATWGHFMIDLVSYVEYNAAWEFGPMVEHFLFAEDGSWGVATSHGEYALVGGSSSFIASVREALVYDEQEGVEQLVSDFRAMLEGGSSAAWVGIMLAHVFGPAARARWDR